MARNVDYTFDQQILSSATEILDSLGPFTDASKRSERWRTAKQLSMMISQKLVRFVSPERLEELLKNVHMNAVERLDKGENPNTPIRRAMRPDLTTTELLWGSTLHLGQVWKGFPRDLKQDQPGTFYEAADLSIDAPAVFISLSHYDLDRGKELARKLVSLDVNCWLAAINIEFGGDIVEHVREALYECDAIVGFVTRRFICSLWCRTELHTSLSRQSAAYLVLDTSDELLLELFRHRDTAGVDTGIEYCEPKFNVEILKQMAVEIYGNNQAQVEKYLNRAQDFATKLPHYLGDNPVFCFPSCPEESFSTVELAPFENLVKYF